MKKKNNPSNHTLKRTDDEEESSILRHSEISISGDHIWFYSDITPSSAIKLNAALQELSMRLAPTAFSSMHEVGIPAPIWLHINSFGGDVFSAFAMADTIERISQIVPIITIVEGCAASGATFMSLAGSKRLIRKNAFPRGNSRRPGPGPSTRHSEHLFWKAPLKIRSTQNGRRHSP